MTVYPKHVLLVDDDPDVLQSVSIWLNQMGYEVHRASSRTEAENILRECIVHLAIIDVRLESDLANDRSGLALSKSFPTDLPKIIYTAYPDEDTILEALQTRAGAGRADKFVRKTGDEAPRRLLEAVEELFTHNVSVNFTMTIANPAYLTQLAHDMGFPSNGMFVHDVEEVLRRLFHSEEEGSRAVQLLELKPLFPLPPRAISHTASIVLQAIPHFADGRGAPQAVKLGACSEIEHEHQGFRDLVPRLRGARHAELRKKACSRDLGGLSYVLLGADRLESLILFRHFYEARPPEAIVAFLRHFLTLSYREILDDKEAYYELDLCREYTQELHFTPAKLHQASYELLPNLDLTRQTFQLPGLKRYLINPVAWTVLGGEFRPFVSQKTHMAWCHGDLHSRNILVDDSGDGWLIDFARAKKSHVLRDFVELETDIKFALLTVTDLALLLPFENSLLAPSRLSEALPDTSFEQPDLHKAYQAVRTIRAVAYELLHDDLDMREYYQALLYQTLNVVRLAPGDPYNPFKERDRRHPYLAAALLCERLEYWPKWQVGDSSSVQNPASSPQDVGEGVEPALPPGRLRFLGVIGSMVLLAIVFLGILIALKLQNATWENLAQSTLVFFAVAVIAFAAVGLVTGGKALDALGKVVQQLIGK